MLYGAKACRVMLKAFRARGGGEKAKHWKEGGCEEGCQSL